MTEHNISPVYGRDSRILILGSFPSVKSREMNFFYGHPQNRFWKVLAGLWQEQAPETIEEKKAFLHRHQIAVWDVIASCDIKGSSDSSITNVVPNDIEEIVRQSHIEAIFLNGTKAYELFIKYFDRSKLPPAFKLPSTSPANASWTLARLLVAWEVIKKYTSPARNS